MRQFERAPSPITDTPSWAILTQSRPLRASAKIKYKTALRDYYNFIKDRKLPDTLLPNHPDFVFPDQQILQRFAQFSALTLSGRIVEKQSVKSVCHKISDLTGAIRAMRDTPVDDGVCARVQAYVKGHLVSQGLVSTLRKPKVDFDKDDIEATQDALWLTLDPNCNSARKVRTGRFMMFLNATLWLFGTYGARISAILPKTLQEKTVNVEELWSALDGSKAESKPRAPQSGSDTHAIIGRMISGLRYKDLNIFLLRKQKGSRETYPVITLKQRHVKGNLNTEDDGIVTWALCQDDFLRDHVPYILAFAFADNAFVGYSDPAAMFNAEMGFNIEKITCETREELREVHIFRKSGKSNEPYTQSQWDAAFKLATRQAGYTANITVHRIRSATTQRVNATGISDAQHCHLFGQSMSTFKKHYMNELTSIDAQAITHGERPRLDVAKVLRSASLSICRGLPTKLTAAQDSDVLRVLQNDPEILELERCRDQAQYAGDEASATKFRNKIDKRRSRARLERLKIEQTNYHQSQLAASQDPETSSTIAQQRWCRLMQLQPQHARIANTLEERRHPTTKERIALVQDLIDMVQQEEQSLGIALQQNKPSVCYNGFPAHGTGYQQHIQQPRNLVPETVDIIETCALCISQIPTTQIDAHITERHLHDIPTDCGVFYHTTERQGQLINPGLCPFCLSDDSLPLPGRFRGFTARRDHLDHLIRHLKLIPQGQLDCPHPNCTTSFSHDTLFKHFEVVHGIEGLEQRIESKTNSRKRKRIEKEDGQQISLSASTTTSTNLSFLRTPSELGDHSWSEDSSVKPTTDPAQATKTNFEAWASQLDMMVLPFKVRNPEHNIGRVMKKRRANQGFNEH